MYRKLLFVGMLTLGVSLVHTPAQAWTHYDMLSSGYYDGPTVAGAIGFEDLFEKVPLGAEIELGYSWSDKGDAILASQVFINQNQVNNESGSSGGTLHLGLNGLYRLPTQIGPFKMYVLGGPRYARWDVRHQYFGNNEDFNVVSHVWGLGGGMRGVIDLNSKIRACLQLTLDYYPRSSIYGHDATYYPDDNNVNARNNGAGYTYNYADAARATAVPHIRPRVLIGLMF